MRFCADHGQVISSFDIPTLERAHGNPSGHALNLCQHGVHAAHFRASGLLIEPRIRAAVHTLWSGRKRLYQARAATEMLTNLLGLRDQPRGQVFPLALIGEIIAVPTEEIMTGIVEDSHPSPTDAPVHDPRAGDPRALAPIAARGPRQ
jgi:hypothetical protein